MGLETRVKVTRNFQITIPAGIRNALGIKEGDILVVTLETDSVVVRRAATELPKISIGKALSTDDIEKLIEESIEEVAG
jgi:AbrB family looped-hinge helix DNA binding protein